MQIPSSVSNQLSYLIPSKTKSPLIVGFSGGADSVALLAMLIKSGYSCVAAHCNFQLRGEESLRDARFARSRAQQLGAIVYEEIVFDTLSYAEQNKISVEMACRKLRYEWFEELRIKYKADYIAVAHHRDDKIETLLLNLIRGTGIAGLTSISLLNGRIIRPLLSLSRKEIEGYIADNNLDYVTDSTNLESVYTRNKIRLEILPLLESINPSVRESIAQTIDHLQQVELVYVHAIEQQKQLVCVSDNDKTIIRITPLLKQPSPSALLFELLYPCGFHSDTIDKIAESLTSENSVGNYYTSPTHELLRDRDSLILRERVELGQKKVYSFEIGRENTNLPVNIQYRIEDYHEGYTFDKGGEHAYFDAELLKQPLILRHWESGDRFIPFGMKGSSKLSNYFSDHKFSRFQKQEVWLLCSDFDILWIIGHRTSNKYHVTSKTKQVLHLYL